MREKLMEYKIPDLIKFGGLLLVYTFYMAWWASKVEVTNEHIADTLSRHIQDDAVVSVNVIKNADAIIAVGNVQEKQQKILKEMHVDHANCKAVLQLMDHRIRELEDRK